MILGKHPTVDLLIDESRISKKQIATFEDLSTTWISMEGVA